MIEALVPVGALGRGRPPEGFVRFQIRRTTFVQKYGHSGQQELERATQQYKTVSIFFFYYRYFEVELKNWILDKPICEHFARFCVFLVVYAPLYLCGFSVC